VVKTVHGRLAATVRLHRSSTAMGAASGGAQALGTAPAVAVRAGDPLSSVESS
jgi:hypothetical protein